MVCRASMCSTERMTVEVTALSAGPNPLSAASDGQGESSSFSAMKQEYLAGLPWVAWSKTCGLRPRPLIAPSLMARPTVALARNPDPHTLPRELKPERFRTGPNSTTNGAVPVVDCQIDRGTMPSRQERVPRGQHDGEVLRQAAGQRRVDRREPHRQRLVQVRHRDEHLVRVAAGRGQELLQVRRGDRDDGQAVGPAAA